MKSLTFGCIAATISLCSVPYAHASTIDRFDVSLSGSQLTPTETTNVFFDAGSPHTPSNPTTSTLIVPVAVGPSFSAQGVSGEASSEIDPISVRSNAPVDPPVGGVSDVVLTAVALGLIPQPQESHPTVASFSNPLPPALLLFGTTLIGLLAMGRRRIKSA